MDSINFILASAQFYLTFSQCSKRSRNSGARSKTRSDNRIENSRLPIDLNRWMEILKSFVIAKCCSFAFSRTLLPINAYGLPLVCVPQSTKVLFSCSRSPRKSLPRIHLHNSVKFENRNWMTDWKLITFRLAPHFGETINHFHAEYQLCFRFSSEFWCKKGKNANRNNAMSFFNCLPLVTGAHELTPNPNRGALRI